MTDSRHSRDSRDRRGGVRRHTDVSDREPVSPRAASGFESAPAGEPAVGFSLARPGRIATQIGPIVAPDEATAASLLDAALASVRGPVFLDLTDRWDGLKRMLARRGFTIQRPYLRMGLGRRNPFGDPGKLFVIAGPEFG